MVKASQPLQTPTVGFVGSSDGLDDLRRNGKPTQTYSSTGDQAGNVAMLAKLPLKGAETTLDVVVGFGANPRQAEAAADATLAHGYQKVLAHYNGEGDAIGWQDYLASLDQLPRLQAQAGDGGKLLNASALVLKAQEDNDPRRRPDRLAVQPLGRNGAGRARAPPATRRSGHGTSTSAPWRCWRWVTGRRPRSPSATSSRCRWMPIPRTSRPTAPPSSTSRNRATRCGRRGATGWFLQKTHVDGTIEWVGVQLDQTAMPIMLGYRLWQGGLLGDAEIDRWYRAMLRPAADFLARDSQVNLGWNTWQVKPPADPAGALGRAVGLFAIHHRGGDRRSRHRQRTGAPCRR